MAAASRIDVMPAVSTFDGPYPQTVIEQASFFEENGFVVLPSLLSRENLGELDNELNRIVDTYEKLPSIRGGFDLEPIEDSTRSSPTFRKIGGISELSDVFNALLHHELIVEVLHEVMGPEIHLYRDVVMMKPARIGREKPWHQDAVYWPYEPMILVSALTALDDATAENGFLQVIPGSHKCQYQHYGDELRIDLDQQLQSQTVGVPLKAGDTLLFHSMLLHGSEPNGSNHDRRLTIFSYKPAGLRYIGKAPQPQEIVVSRRDGG